MALDLQYFYFSGVAATERTVRGSMDIFYNTGSLRSSRSRLMTTTFKNSEIG